ncbi:hypothetical protein NDU88_001723 [Pleurodeles waltl]|uniref:Uncharacterized protein n=1 Tax=Pleurodeles waltl TaxID=8319 RepID=A0AAV7Q3Y2_PLEWA|nr:hypothetical protein NDU88_001723 [Pleurodeles waltl]
MPVLPVGRLNGQIIILLEWRRKLHRHRQNGLDALVWRYCWLRHNRPWLPGPSNKGAQQTKMEQYTAQNAGGSLQKDYRMPTGKGDEPTGIQILAAIEASGQAVQVQIAAIAVDINLLRVDLRVVAEHSVATEKQVTSLQTDMDTLKATVRFLSDHVPLLLECETHTPRPKILMWRLRPELLGDPEYKGDMRMDLNGYFTVKWSTTLTQGIEWEALNVVIRGESIGKTFGIRKKLEWELTQQEDVLTALQSRVTSGEISEADCHVTRTKI